MKLSTTKLSTQLILLIVLIMVGFACRDKGIEPPPPPTIGVSIDELGVTEAWLRVKFTTQTEEPRAFKLKRDGQTILTANNSPLDTVLLDGNLLPKHTYNFKVYKLVNNIPVDSSAPLLLTTIDTTTHEFTWEIDTLGGTQSWVNGLWGSDENNMYAVGHFTTIDTTAHLAHWDGSMWKLLKPISISGYEGIAAGDLQSIFGISPNKIWTVGYGFYQIWGVDTVWGFVAEWNGSVWHNISPNAPHIYFFAVWASSASDVYVVGSSGYFFHYDGVNWNKIETGTDFNLFDVWGFSNKDIYMTGYPVDQSSGIVLHYDGIKVERINVLPPNSIVSFRSVWGTSQRFMFVASDGGLFTNRKSYWQEELYPGDRAALVQVRGNSKNNIFVCGHVGKLLHFNGYSWKNYEPQFGGSDVWIVHSVQTFGDKVFWGGSGGEGFDRRGIILRGRR